MDIKMNLIFILVVLVFMICMIIGFTRGILRTSVGVAATIFAFVLSYVGTPLASQALIRYTNLDEKIEERVYDSVEERVRDTVEKKLAESGLDGWEPGEDAIHEMMDRQPDKSEQISLLQNLPFPDYIRSSLIDNNHEEIYEQLGVTSVYRYIARSISYMVINIIAGVLTFVVIRLVLWLLTLSVNKAARDIPLVAGVDKIGGMLVGMATAVLFSWLVIAIGQLAGGESAVALVEGSKFLRLLNTHNYVSELIGNITDILF